MFNRIKIYTVHIKPDEHGSSFRPVFIKEGFNYTGFFLTLLWALYKRMWAVAACLLLVNVLLFWTLKMHALGRLSVLAIHFGVHLVVGFQGNDWIRSRLNREGYILSDITAADSYLRAQQRYLERYVAATAQ